MRPVLLATLTGLAAAIPAAEAAAQSRSRYAPRPPVVLSPDLTEPWITQIRPRYRDVAGAAPAIRVVAPPPAVAVTPVEPIRVIEPITINPASDGSRERVASVQPRRTREVNAAFLPAVVPYAGSYPAGTIIINTVERYLYLVQDDGSARRYGVGVGRPGFQWAGEHRITRKAEWPDWRPPAEMLKRQPQLPRFMAGGPSNPLGARAMYLGSSLYRIHGSNEPWTIGQAVSSGCIRMRNEDVTDLYQRVKVGTRVIVI